MATAWTFPKNMVALATCTSGSESAPTLVTEGLALSPVKGRPVGSLVVHGEAAGAQTVGTYRAYLWNPVTARWNRATDLDIVNTTDRYQASSGIVVPGAYTGGRIAYVPNGVGVAINLYLVGTK